MPSDPIGILFYIFLIFPGLAYRYATAGHRATTRRSPFREVAAVVAVSALCWVVIVLIVFIFSLVVPGISETMKSIVLDPNRVFSRHPTSTVGWLLGFLAFSTVIGFLLGGEKLYKRRTKFLQRFGGSINETSGWEEAFDTRCPGESEVHVGIQLKSGAWVQGVLLSRTPSTDEGPDRSILLSGCIQQRLSGRRKLEDVKGYEVLVVHATEIDFMSVGYYPPGTSDRWQGIAPRAGAV
ncbi:DUF6338 family protein [Saxibacter everestensis]|uniref:DUF6338 family protein n=1 Tax=Saxibacter everestensis TaxID=2909229 RepID=A0ABY8QS95_9MICO|nr:DUF6338 family protein [Brevibacteriaceae bacterium ZFBP1038]